MEITRDGDGYLVRLPEQFLGVRHSGFTRAVRRAVEQGMIDLTVDFDGTEIVDSMALGMLVAAARELQQRGGALIVVNLSGEIRELFFDTGLDRVFSIDSRQSASKASTDISGAVDIRLEIREESAGDIHILHVAGVMNHPAGTEYFQDRFWASMAQFRKILLEMGDLTYIDSLSLSVVLKMNRLLRETGGSLRICGANILVSDLFDTLKLGEVIPRFENATEAIAAPWE